MIKVTIDGREIELEHPVTVLEAAKQAGIAIPTLCYFEGLTPFGGCRLCLVEVEKLPKLQTSCTLMTADGMVVRTETDQIRAARRSMLEFLLINHPLDCPYCDKAGECELQDLVARYGPEAGRFAEGKRRHPESFDDPIIVRNMERCVLCTRCVRMCNDLQGSYSISVTGRGSHSFVEPFSGGRYDCEYCGNCLTVCPVGAIMSRLHRHSYRPWFVEKETETVCGFCGVGCSMVLQMRENSIIRAIPRRGIGFNEGLLCVRGRFGYEYVEGGEELTTPLMKVDGELRQVSWEDAVSFVVKRLREIRDEFGGGAVGAIASGRCTNEDNYMLQKLVRFILGSNNIDSAARNYYAPAELYLERIFGQGITANLISGIANSDGVFVAGGDPTAINPILGLQVRSVWRSGGRVIVLGVPGGLKRFIPYELTPVPYSEEIVLSAIVGRLLEDKPLRGENAALEAKLRSLRIPSDDELGATGVSSEDIVRVAGDLSSMTTPVVVIGPDVVQRKRASKSLFLLGAIAYLTNARIFLLAERPNYQGLLDMGCLPELLPGGRPVELEMFRHKTEEALGMKAPEEKGLNLFEMIEAAAAGRLKALYVMGENPLFNIPDSAKVEKALENLDLLVVQDVHLTETARIADVVLPATAWPEKEGTFTNLERRLQRVRKARRGKMASYGRDDWKILADIAERLGMTKTYHRVEDVWEEIMHVSALHTGLGYEEIAGGSALWPYYGEPLRGMEGDFPVEGLDELPEVTVPEKPYLMIDRPLYHSGTFSRRSKALLGIHPGPSLVISPLLAERHGLSDGDKARISNGRGVLELKVKLDGDIPDNQVFLANTFEGFGAMGLIGFGTDSVLGSIYIDDNTVRVEKVLR
ncbi:MAG: molybdopterin-dependent oxidoreductase [Nitrospirae bacterium]|nr:molybdopterin-dependent oxidoreductase [Nitrospirota bacterium]